MRRIRSAPSNEVREIACREENLPQVGPGIYVAFDHERKTDFHWTEKQSVNGSDRERPFQDATHATDPNDSNHCCFRFSTGQPRHVHSVLRLVIDVAELLRG